MVGTFHSNFRPGWFWSVTQVWQRRYLERLDVAIAVSHAAAAPYGGKARGRFRVVPNGVDVERFARGLAGRADA